MNFILENAVEVVDTETYGRLDESPELRREVMSAMAKQLRLFSTDNEYK
jgi:hypothetical protein